MSLLLFQGGGANGVRPSTMVQQWKSLCRPTMEYGCEFWEGEESVRWSTDLESVQNQFCRAILGFGRLKPATCALLSDLGLPTLKTRRKILKLGFWKRLCDARPDRLLSRLFRKRHQEVLAGSARLSCLRSMGALLCEFKFGHFWTTGTVPSDWAGLVRARAWLSEAALQTANMASCSSLLLYRSLGHGFRRGTHPFLDDRDNIHGTRLKSSLRFGTIFTMSRVARTLKWPESGAHCLLCRRDIIEDALHLFVECEQMTQCRNDLLLILDRALRQCGEHGAELFAVFYDAMCSDSVRALQLLSGAVVELSRPRSSTMQCHEEQCAKAAWLFDKISKNYLVRCWREREARIGKLTVQKGVLVHERPAPGAPNTGSLPLKVPVSPPALDRLRWQPWLRLQQPSKLRVKSGANKRAPFFVVWKTRSRTQSRSVFYRWTDAFRASAGAQGVVKGYESLSAAVEASRRGY